MNHFGKDYKINFSKGYNDYLMGREKQDNQENAYYKGYDYCKRKLTRSLDEKLRNCLKDSYVRMSVEEFINFLIKLIRSLAIPKQQMIDIIITSLYSNSSLNRTEFPKRTSEVDIVLEKIISEYLEKEEI